MNYLSTDHDRMVAAKGLKLTRKIVMESETFKKYKPEEYRPGLDINDDEELVKAGSDYTQTIFHPVGTCKMGQDDMAVVDEKLKVKGVKNLRVIDASIMPNITSGNTNAPTIMIAEKGADMILRKLMFAELFTPEQLTILTQIILIDLVLAGDNAIIIGMVASKFPLEQRKKIIFWGIGGAVILRIILTLLTAYLLQITGLRLLGGLLLLYIVYKLYTDVIKGSDHEEDIKVDNSSFLKAIWTILLADFTMSLDNVLGVAGAAGDHYKLLIFGLVLSIALMAFAATLISNWIKKYKWIAWAGLIAILIVAIELIYTDIQILFL